MTVVVVGMACRYPDANTPDELWDNAVSARRAFRRIPPERLSVQDYFDPDPTVPDKIYMDTAAVLEGYEFDRTSYRIAGSTFRSTDPTHWLALEVAAGALADAGFDGADGLPRDRTGVIMGNSLTGEFSRANLMRLRWPYVRRVVSHELASRGWGSGELSDFLTSLEASYKRPYPAVDEDTLAGGLSNTIAGRICNYFDLGGGGYTVDGACSSSLLSVITGARAILDGDLDVAIVGGVDLSIDPFEMIGFAKTGALARREMRLYDQDSNGFWPGEGCGVLVLMNEDTAAERGLTPYARIPGWGISSDGRGGITRPEVSGYRTALHRAYELSGFGIDTVEYFEGHGTGTPVGDRTELQAISEELREAGRNGTPSVIGSIKGQFGHTKAAAGVAGLIKAIQAVRHAVIPPTVACSSPHDLLEFDQAPLRATPTAEPWPADTPRRAGVTSMGFGGINTHVVVEATAATDQAPVTLWRPQEEEILLFSADTPDGLRGALTAAADHLAMASYGELADYAASLIRDTANGQGTPGAYRAAVVATSPKEAVRLLDLVHNAIDERDTTLTSLTTVAPGAHWGTAGQDARIGLLFPGQGVGSSLAAGALHRHFHGATSYSVRAVAYRSTDPTATEAVQPQTVLGSLAGLHVLDQLGVTARVAVGHSLGELTALHWAGAYDETTLEHLASRRGQIMAEHSQPGRMLNLATDRATSEQLIAGTDAVIAAENSPRHTVVAGTAQTLATVARVAETRKIASAPLQTSHAFHSPLVASSQPQLEELLTTTDLAPLNKTVISTVRGQALPTDTDLTRLLVDQVTEPVEFYSAVTTAAQQCDLLIEVGPGTALTQLASISCATPSLSMDTGSSSLKPLLSVAAATWVVGALTRLDALVEGRNVKPVRTQRTFLANPAESAPTDLDVELLTLNQGLTSGDTHTSTDPSTSADTEQADAVTAVASSETQDPATLKNKIVEHLITLAADRAELPTDMITPDSRLLEDLHLSSITIGQILAEVGREFGLASAAMPTNMAVASVSELADHVASLCSTQPAVKKTRQGQDWIGTFTETNVPKHLPPRRPEATTWGDGSSWTSLGVGHPGVLDDLAADVEQDGILIGVSPNPDRAEIHDVFRAVKQAASAAPGTRVVMLGGTSVTAALAKTLVQERPDLTVTVIESPSMKDVDIVGEVRATDTYSHVRYVGGQRTVPTLAPYKARGTSQPALGPDDVVVVSGGNKGITAECAIALAEDTRATIAVLGRSDASTDTETAATLKRLHDTGAQARYYRADVTDPAQVRSALEAINRDLGTVTAIIHGAGTNQPRSLGQLEWDDVTATLAPKVDGLLHLLESTPAHNLKLLVTFGSIIGRLGLQGEAHYALANAELAQATLAFGTQNPSCKAVCLEWSVWSEVGMGERLDVLDSLQSMGITPITAQRGRQIFMDVVNRGTGPNAVLVSGRTAGIPTARMSSPDLPLWRYLERVDSYYRGNELVVEAKLSLANDPYLSDHVLDGNHLFPAVFGLEAMTQAASALEETTASPTFHDVQFERPVVVPVKGSLKIRIEAVARAGGGYDVAIYSAETEYTVPHFQAIVEFGPTEADPPVPVTLTPHPPTSLNPANDLYGSLLFQGTSFQRLIDFASLTSKQASARVRVGHEDSWFAGHHSPHMVLGDPGTRDALLHGNQVCVPDSILLPEGVDTIRVTESIDQPGIVTFQSVETRHDGDLFVYDIDVRDDTGRVVEQWRGLRLRAVNRRTPDLWPAALIGPHLERVLEDEGLNASIAVDHSGGLTVRAEGESVLSFDVRPTLGTPDDLNDLLRGSARAYSDGRPIAVRDARRGVTCASTGTTDLYSIWANVHGVDSPQIFTIITRRRDAAAA